MVDFHVFYHDRWEEDRLDYLLYLIHLTVVDPTEQVFFFDVGSYFGQYSLVIKSMFPAISTMAFEANPYNYIQLRANLLLNAMIEDIATYNRCVSDESGRTRGSKPQRENRGSAAVGDAYSGTEKSTFIVDSLVFDKEFGSISGSLLFMKMDIEGSEPMALAGMKSLASHNKMVIQIEDWNFPDSDINRLLCAMGFTMIQDMTPDYFYAHFDALKG